MQVSRWFATEQLSPTVTRIVEPHVHPLLQANAWHVRGTERDVLIDSGLGLVSLRADLPDIFSRVPVLVITHAHLDHIGGAYEFDIVAAHPSEADLIEHPRPASLFAAELCDQLGIAGDYRASLPELLIDVDPYIGFDPSDYTIRPATVTRTVVDGDQIDLGDRLLTVLHLPGHSPGSIGLLDESAGALFSGDALYDGLLLDDLDESDVAQYCTTMRRLSAGPWEVIYPGHGNAIGSDRAHEIATTYLHSRS